MSMRTKKIYALAERSVAFDVDEVARSCSTSAAAGVRVRVRPRALTSCFWSLGMITSWAGLQVRRERVTKAAREIQMPKRNNPA
jgi:hypothetical protein